MNKTNLLVSSIILFALLFTSCKKKESKNDLELANLKGNIKTIYTSSIIKVKDFEETRKVSLSKYNLEGYEIYREDYGDGEESGESNTEYLRDKNNNITEEIVNYKSLAGNSKSKKKYKYDKKNELIEVTAFGFNDNILDVCEYKYDNKGNVISKFYTGEIKSDSTIFKYKYENDLIIEKTEKNVDSKSSTIYNYNTDNKLTFMIGKNEKGTESYRYEYIYNEKGNKVEEYFTTENDKIPRITKFYYDERNNLIEEKSSRDGNLENIISYEYDEIGNWIKEINSVADVYGTTYVTERKIEYYSDKESDTKKDNFTEPIKTETEKDERKADKSDSLILKDVKIALLDAGKNKCDLLLGSPDRDDILYMGSESKLVRVYLSKVIDTDGKTKHLVLFLRDNYKQKIFVEDIKAINDGEKAYFGIHYVQVNNGVVTSNSHDFGIVN